jgi:hypothetical protein
VHTAYGHRMRTATLNSTCWPSFELSSWRCCFYHLTGMAHNNYIQFLHSPASSMLCLFIQTCRCREAQRVQKVQRTRRKVMNPSYIHPISSSKFQRYATKARPPYIIPEIATSQSMSNQAKTHSLPRLMNLSSIKLTSLKAKRQM